MTLRALRVAAAVLTFAGAIGSLALMFYAGRHAPQPLIVLFFFWVLSPYVGLGVAHTVARRWAGVTQATLYWVTIVIALGSVATYARDALVPRKAQAAFVYVAIPPASWLLGGAVVSTAALIAHRRRR